MSVATEFFYDSFCFSAGSQLDYNDAVDNFIRTTLII